MELQKQFDRLKLTCDKNYTLKKEKIGKLKSLNQSSSQMRQTAIQEIKELLLKSENRMKEIISNMQKVILQAKKR